jgi:polar amino acid transport system substrate-binding protein
MFKKGLILVLMGLFVVVAGPVGADTIDKVRKRGEIVVGVKADYRPWGFRDTNGNLIGLEIDLAKEVAEKLGVSIRLVAVQTSNRMQFLESGRLDMFIATMTDRADRRKVVGIVTPNYYSSGTNGMTLKSHGFKAWEETRGKPVCSKQGSFFNKKMEQTYGMKLVSFVNNTEAKLALRDKRCLVWMLDDSSIQADLQLDMWKDYQMPFKTIDAASWGIAVPKAEQEGVFGRFMSGMVHDWHVSGRLVELEKKWGIKSTAYLREMHELYKKAATHGSLLK